MGITYIFGRDLIGYETAFTNRLIYINNPHKELEVEILFKLQIFNLKKDAVMFCKRWNLKPESIIQVYTRFQKQWVINMQGHEFLPNHAEGHLIAATLGKTLHSVDKDI